MTLARLAVVLFALLAAESSANAQCTGPNCHTLSGSLSDATTGPFLSGHTYVITGAAEVASGNTLTIQPGAVIKMTAWFNVLGTLLADGTAGQPIIFTSTRDDTAGGDTNGDGSATSPVKGNWYGLRFFAASGGSSVSHVETRYTGASASAAFIVKGAASGLDFNNITCKTGYGEAMRFEFGAATVNNLDVDDFESPAWIRTLSDAALLTNVTSVNCDADSLVMKNPSIVTSSTSLTSDNLPNGTGCIVARGHVTVNAGATLTLGPGVTIKLDGAWRFNVKGTLIASGTALNPVTFTSVDDNSAGGVTGTGAPAPGDWGTLILESTSVNSTLTHTHVRYGGSSEHASCVSTSAPVWLDHCTIAHSSANGVRADGGPTITNCHLIDNAEAPITSVPIQELALFMNNTASGNGDGDVVQIKGAVTASATLKAESAFNGTDTFALTSTMQVQSPNVLTIEPGVVLKIESGSIQVPGVLVCKGTPGNEVIFTSIHDDSVGGDTNNNGNATSPASGDWSGLSLHSAIDGTVFEHVIVRYAGAGGGSSVGIANATPPITDSLIEHGGGPALNASGNTPTLVRCAFNNCAGSAPIVNLGIEALTDIEACTADGNATTNSILIDASTIESDLVIDTASTLNGDGVLLIDGNVTVNPAGSLALGAGMILKFTADQRLEVRGPFSALGEAGNEVVFTDITDDIGGDSDGSGGPPSDGTPGSWRNIFITGLDNVTMQHALVRNAGFNGEAAIELFAAGGTFNSLVVEDCLGPGFVPSSLALSVTNSSFDRCTRPIDRVSAATLGSFSNNTAAGNTLGNAMRITSPGAAPVGGFVFSKDASLNGDGVFFMNTNLATQSFETMTISVGVVLKFMHPDHLVTISGALDVNGSAAEPVVFTSIHDDDFGGADNSGTAPAPGDWRGLLFQMNSDASVIDHAIIRYAGSDGAAAIDLLDADITLSNVLIEFSGGDGIDTNGSSVPTLTNVDIDNNTDEAIDGLTWPVLANMTGVSATGNGTSLDATVINSPFVKGDVVIEKDNVFGACIVVNVTPSVSPAHTLSFGRGVIVKAGAADVAMPVKHVGGTGVEKTIFTSFLDDEHGGDTNGDGAATLPAPGDWIGIQSPSGTINHALVRYAGADFPFDDPAPGIDGNTVNSTRVERCAGDGVVAGENHNVVAYRNGGIGIRGSSAVNCTAAMNDEVGIWATRVIYSVSWFNGPTLNENYFETTGPIIGCPPCQCDVMYSIGSSLGLSGPVPGAPGQFGCPSTGWGNTFVDPLFVDLLGGDLRLKAASPARNYVLDPISPAALSNTNICTPWGISGTLHPDPPPTSRDHLDNPRRVDDQLIGWSGKVADLGAYERVLWRLETSGSTELGEPADFVVTGPSGTAVLLTGFPTFGEDAYLNQWNWLMIDPTNYLALAVIPTNTPLILPLPLEPILQGLQVSFQAGVTPSSAPSLHTMTNVFDARLHL